MKNTIFLCYTNYTRTKFFNETYTINRPRFYILRDRYFRRLMLIHSSDSTTTVLRTGFYTS